MQGYVAARQYETALDNIKWATDYFIKCVGDGSTIVGQVGSGYEDHCEYHGLGTHGGQGGGSVECCKGCRGRLNSRWVVQAALFSWH